GGVRSRRHRAVRRGTGGRPLERRAARARAAWRRRADPCPTALRSWRCGVVGRPQVGPDLLEPGPAFRGGLTALRRWRRADHVEELALPHHLQPLPGLGDDVLRVVPALEPFGEVLDPLALLGLVGLKLRDLGLLGQVDPNRVRVGEHQGHEQGRDDGRSASDPRPSKPGECLPRRPGAPTDPTAPWRRRCDGAGSATVGPRTRPAWGPALRSGAGRPSGGGARAAARGTLPARQRALRHCVTPNDPLTTVRHGPTRAGACSTCDAAGRAVKTYGTWGRRWRRRNAPRRRAPPRCAAAGCTSPPAPSAPEHRS